MRVVILKPDNTAHVEEEGQPNNVQWLQNQVGGTFEMVQIKWDSFIMWMNEDAGIVPGFEPNALARRLLGSHIIWGTVVVTGPIVGSETAAMDEDGPRRLRDLLGSMAEWS